MTDERVREIAAETCRAFLKQQIEAIAAACGVPAALLDVRVTCIYCDRQFEATCDGNPRPGDQNYGTSANCDQPLCLIHAVAVGERHYCGRCAPLMAGASPR